MNHASIIGVREGVAEVDYVDDIVVDWDDQGNLARDRRRRGEMTIDFDYDSVIPFKAVTDGESVTVVHLDVQDLKFTGSAKCLPSDTFDPYTGELLAVYRAVRKWMKSLEKELHEIGGILE